MNKTLLFAALIAVTFQTADLRADESVCSVLHRLAYSIMDARQKEVSIPELMELTNNSGNEVLTDIGGQMVIKAYESTAYSSKEYQDKASAKFANRVYLECLKNESGSRRR